MKNVFLIAQNEGILVVPVPGDSDTIQERASRSILACLLCHCGLGKKMQPWKPSPIIQICFTF